MQGSLWFFAGPSDHSIFLHGAGHGRVGDQYLVIGIRIAEERAILFGQTAGSLARAPGGAR
jgi:hypothetical protein